MHEMRETNKMTDRECTNKHELLITRKRNIINNKKGEKSKAQNSERQKKLQNKIL